MSEELDINVAIKSCEIFIRNGVRGYDSYDAFRGVYCEECPGAKRYNKGVPCDDNGWGNGCDRRDDQEKCRASATAFLAKHKPAKPVSNQMTTKAIQQERIQRIIKDCGGPARFCKLLPKIPYATVVSWTRTDNTVRVPPEYTIDLIEMALEVINSEESK